MVYLTGMVWLYDLFSHNIQDFTINLWLLEIICALVEILLTEFNTTSEGYFSSPFFCITPGTL